MEAGARPEPQDMGPVDQRFRMLAAKNLAYVGDLPISAKHVQRITKRLGRERARQRDQEVEQMQAQNFHPRIVSRRRSSRFMWMRASCVCGPTMGGPACGSRTGRIRRSPVSYRLSLS